MAEGNTDGEDIGMARIMILLTNAEMVESPIFYLNLNVMGEYDPDAFKITDDMRPVPFLRQISEVGLVTIDWNKEMKKPRSIEQIETGLTEWYFWEEKTTEVVPVMQLVILRGENTPHDANLAFNFTVVSFDSYALIL